MKKQRLLGLGWGVAVVASACWMPAQTSSKRETKFLSAPQQEIFASSTEALRQGHVEEAAAGFRRVTLEAPGFAEGWFDLGLALAQGGHNDEAGKALQHALVLKPQLRGANLFLAITEYKSNRLEEAATAIRKETKANAPDAQAWMWQGIIDLGLNHLTTAVDALDRASSLDGTNVDILYHRGRAALALSRSSYEEMFKIDPKSWHVHQVLAEADVESDHDGDAVEQWKLAIASAPPQGGLYEALGSSLWRTGKFEEAHSAFEMALKLDPGDTLTMYKLGCLLVDRGNATQGKPLLESAIVADPSLKLASYYLGRAESELGNDQKAVEDFKKVIAENVDVDTTKQAYFQLARSARRLHDNAAAAAAQAQYRVLDQQGRDDLQEKLSQRRVRGDRDISIPAPSPPANSSEPE